MTIFTWVPNFWGPISIPVFMSEESKTMDMKPVFNTITYTPKPNGDWWVMDQSHLGKDASKKNWDRIGIWVDKTSKPFSVRYYQIEPYGNGTKEIPPKVKCFVCHTNGPRAIRPDDSNNLGIKNKIKIQYLNLVMKAYGPVSISKNQIHPIRFSMEYANQEIKIPTCMKCHNTDSNFGRGKLYTQNIATIKNMINRGHMPPLGFKMTTKDHEILKIYLKK